MPSGGPRTGTPGKRYPNRTDLNTPAPSQQYGQRVAQERAMAAIPLSPPRGPNVGGVGAAPGQPAPTPPTPVTDLFAPTTRPDEPVTSGANLGPGAGPEAIGGAGDPIALRLRAIYNLMPNEALRELLEDLEDELG